MYGYFINLLCLKLKKKLPNKENIFTIGVVNIIGFKKLAG